MTGYATRPDDAPEWEGPDDAQLAAEDAAIVAMNAAAQRAKDVDEKAYWIRVTEEARAKVLAEKAAHTNFADQYLDRAGLLDLKAPDPLIAKVLPRHAYAILRGRDHSFKSFAAIDWACCLATGKHWQGHAVEQARVLYIAGEGAHGLANRIAAWEYAWGRNVPAEMLTVRRTALNMHQPGPAFHHLLEHVAAGGYGLVVVDTLRRVSGAADGNSSEMGAVIDNLDLVKQATADGSVLTVAHTDKGDHDTRGYSGIEDDADVVWAAKRDEMYLTLELTKMKDGPDGRTLILEAQPIPTCNSLVLADTGGPGQADTTESQAKILDALRIMPEGGVTAPDLMATAGLAKATFYRALKELREAGQVLMTKTGRTKYYELPALPDDLAEDSPESDTATPDEQLNLDQEDET